MPNRNRFIDMPIISHRSSLYCLLGHFTPCCFYVTTTSVVAK
jgi:hypothetical protein